MHETPVQILEVRGPDADRPVTITVTLTAAATRAICTALSEQLDRRRAEPALSADDIVALRRHVALAEQFEPLARAEAHAILPLGGDDLRACLLELTRYADRVDGDHFQPPELRERLQVIGEIMPVLWDANAAGAAACAERAPLMRLAS